MPDRSQTGDMQLIRLFDMNINKLTYIIIKMIRLNKQNVKINFAKKKIYTDNFCIYMHAVSTVTNPLVLPFNVRQISITCQFFICFVPFSYVAFLYYRYLLLLRFSYGETMPFTIRLVPNLRMTSSDVTFTQRQQTFLSICGLT